MLPSERGDVGEQLVGRLDAGTAEVLDGAVMRLITNARRSLSQSPIPGATASPS